jgi:hypothetical protein
MGTNIFIGGSHDLWVRELEEYLGGVYFYLFIIFY